MWRVNTRQSFEEGWFIPFRSTAIYASTLLVSPVRKDFLTLVRHASFEIFGWYHTCTATCVYNVVKSDLSGATVFVRPSRGDRTPRVWDFGVRRVIFVFVWHEFNFINLGTVVGSCTTHFGVVVEQLICLRTNNIPGVPAWSQWTGKVGIFARLDGC